MQKYYSTRNFRGIHLASFQEVSYFTNSKTDFIITITIILHFNTSEIKMPLTIDIVFQCWGDKYKGQWLHGCYYLLLAIAKQIVFSCALLVQYVLNCCLKYLQNVCIIIHQWNKFIVYPKMHGNKSWDINLVLAKYSSLEDGHNFWFSAKQEMCALWNTKKHIHNYIYGATIFSYWYLCKKLFHMPFSTAEEKTKLPNPSE